MLDLWELERCLFGAEFCATASTVCRYVWDSVGAKFVSSSSVCHSAVSLMNTTLGSVAC